MPEQKKNPEISVIMGVYNQRNETILREAVFSILHQTFTDFEFIIWDDGSSLEAAEMIRSLSALDPRIRLAGKEENRGLAYSLNACIRLARGKYLARMDADDISHPERLQRQYEFLEAQKEYAWCGCNAHLFDGHGIWGSRKMPLQPQAEDYLRFSPYIHPTVMFRAELFDANAGYLESEETLRCEDYEIFMRFWQNGLKGYNLQEPLFCYREDQDSYRRRTFHFRLNEAKLRYRNFKKMGMLFPGGWPYVIRPIAGAVLPAGIIRLLKRREGIRAGKEELCGKESMQQAEALYEIPQYPRPESTAQQSLAGMSGITETGRI